MSFQPQLSRTIPTELSRLMAVGYLILIALTWPLWIPQDSFPQVPFFSQANQIPTGFEWALLVGLIAGLSGLLLGIADRWSRLACLGIAGCSAGLVLIDQHRFQPWAWQFMVISLLMAFSDRANVVRGWRWLVIGIYAWSAWSKFDYSFCVSHGVFLWEGFCKSIGLGRTISGWNGTTKYVAVSAIPVIELLIAVGLGFKRTRTIALTGSFGMHVGLLLSLGPLGHGHQPGVLAWNLFFLVQNWILFRPERNPDQTRAAGALDSKKVAFSLREKKAELPEAPVHSVTNDQELPEHADHPTESPQLNYQLIIVVVVLIWPILEPLGLCDHWPAWAVYAAKPERVTVFIQDEEIAKLPKELTRYIGPPLALDGWIPFRIDRWSLDAVMVPIYPQDRYQIGVALGLANRFKLNQLRIRVEGPADRWTGRRTIQDFQGLDAVEQFADTFRLNARPRPMVAQ